MSRGVILIETPASSWDCLGSVQRLPDINSSECMQGSDESTSIVMSKPPPKKRAAFPRGSQSDEAHQNDSTLL